MIRNFRHLLYISNAKPNIIYSKIIRTKYEKKKIFIITILLKNVIILFNGETEIQAVRE